MADRACQPTSFGSDGFDQLLDDVAPTLLDFLDALDTKADALPAPRHSLPSVEVKEEASSSAAAAKDKPKTKSNTWRQRQRLEVLRLRDEVKQLDAELKKRKLAAGVRSTLPPVSSVGAALAIKRPAARKLLNESWRDAAFRESLARQMADVENERLHKVMRMQVKHARKLYRMMTQQMTTAVVAQALGCRPGLTGDECYPPSDNNAVFRKLLAELDDHGGSMNSIFVTSGFYGGSGSRKDNSQVTINRTRGLQVQVVSRYTVPFTVEATERAVWEVLTRINEKESRVAYSEVRLCVHVRWQYLKSC
ncbi:unnamed protein product [Phytophthora lilii]|uniref:Unnamed protein product n=1 Tax=Phytophthora lilii TaxID=2077276 RepID=A0A9W6U948_9STRA|nr:unnamed protein product [Phytophthora lilii]